MLIEGSVISDIGRIRQNNEDNFFLNGLYRKDINNRLFTSTEIADCRQAVYAVCDGMGGEEYGEIASLCAASALKILKNAPFTEELLDKYIKNVQSDIINKSHNLLSESMGSTLALLYIKDNTGYALNLGDSRIYLYRRGKLKQLTKDHTQASLLIDSGILTADEARQHISSHMLTRYLGTGSNITAKDIYKAENIKLYKDDIFLLCSDGLTDMLPDNEIEQSLFKTYKNGTGFIVQNLCTKALEAGGRDNITCIAVKMVKKGRFLSLNK
ncbi:MAG: protein phosphatase 2C domain-containing protein [Lachnospiraceae bacterium]